MITLQIENVPDDLVENLRVLARAEQRTLNEEIVFLLNRVFVDSARRERAREVFAEIDRIKIKLPIGAPDSVELLREDRTR